MAKQVKATQLISDVDKLASQFAKLYTQIKKNVDVVSQAQQAFSKTSKSQSDVAIKTRDVKKALTEVEKIQIRANKITLESVKATEALRDKRKALTDQVRRDNGTINKSGGLFKSMTKSILAAGAAMLSIRAVFNIFKSGIKTITRFEGEMSKVRAVTGATVGDFKSLQINAKLLGATTSKTAIEVAGLQLEFSKLGFSTKEILNATEATISLSIAAGSDLAESAVVAASTIRGFGLDAKDTQSVVDIMAKSFSSSALDLDKFKTSMAISAPIAKNFGKDLSFTTAQLSVLSDAGVDASTSGTSLRNIFLELSKRGLTWEEGLQMINDSTNKNVTALELFGKRGATAAIILAENTDKANKLEQSYTNSAGAAKRMADIMEDNLTGETKKLSSAWEGFVLSLNKGDGSISNFLRGIVKTATKFLGLITNTEKESEALGKMRIEMNANLNAIKNQELPLNVRKGLIEKINTQYKDYLPNLIDEKTSLSDIEEIQNQANKALLENIRIKAQQELLTEQINKIAELEVKIAKEQIRVEKLKSGEISYTASAYLTQEQQISGLQNTIKGLTGEYEKEVEELNKIQSIFEKLNPAQEAAVKTTEDSTKAINDNTKAIKGNYKTQAEIDEEVEQERLTAFQAAKKKQEELDLESDKKLMERKTALIEGSEEERKAAMIQALQEEYDLKIANAEKIAEREKEIDKAKTEVKIAAAEAAGQILSDQFSGFIDNDLAAFEAGQEAERKILDDKLDKGELSEEQYQKKILALEKRGRIESAKSEKKKAIFDATIAAAVSVIKQLAATPLPAGAPFIAAAAAIGAIQIGVAASTPIPKYKTGTKRPTNKGEYAIVGDGGQSELVKTPLGSYLSDNKPQTVWLPKGSEVFSGADTKELTYKHSNNINIDALIQEQRLTRSAIFKQSKHISTTTWAGHKYIVKKANETKIELDKYFG